MNYHPGNIMLHIAVALFITMILYATLGLSLMSGILTVAVVAIALATLHDVFPTFWRDE